MPSGNGIRGAAKGEAGGTEEGKGRENAGEQVEGGGPGHVVGLTKSVTALCDIT